MELSDTQKATVASWVGDRKSLAQIQNLLREKFEISMTYMDVRFLLDDLNINYEEPDTEASSAEEKDVEKAKEPELVGGVSVEVNPVTPPGALVAGTATFSDGKQMPWQMSTTGQLGLLPGDDPDYRPSSEDVQEFQSQLQKVLQKHGY